MPYTAVMKLHAYTGGVASANSYILEAKDGTLIVIDAAQGVTKWLKGKFPEKKVSYLLLTHLHFDHVMDAAALKAEYGCKIVAQSAYGEEYTLIKGVRSSWGIELNLPDFEVDDVLGAGTVEKEWGGYEWRASHLPGHAPESEVFYMPTEGVVFTGDTIFDSSIGRTDLPGGDLQLLLGGLRKVVLSLPQKTAILPGHGRDTTVEAENRKNPFLQD